MEFYRKFNNRYKLIFSQVFNLVVKNKKFQILSFFVVILVIKKLQRLTLHLFLFAGCDGAPLLPLLFIIVNMGFNISLLHLLKISSAVVSCLATTVAGIIRFVSLKGYQYWCSEYSQNINDLLMLNVFWGFKIDVRFVTSRTSC